MRLARVLAISRKNLQSLRHDRRTAGFLVLMPLLMITIFGYTFGGDPKHLAVDIVNLDQAPANKSIAVSITEDISTRNTLKLVKIVSGPDGGVDDVAASRERVQDASIKATLVFPVNFTRDVLAALDSIRNSTQATPASFIVYIDGTNPNIVQSIMSDIQKSVQKTIVSSSFGVVSPIVVVPELAYGQNARFIDFFAPGVMGLAAMMVTFMLSIISFVHERSTSTLDRLLTTPVTEGEIVAGYALAFGIVGLIQSSVIIATAVLLFQISIQGSVLLVLFIVFVFGVGNQGLGFLLSSVAKNEFQAIQFMPLILFPSILLSGVFWPIEAVPDILRPVSYFVPLTYATDSMRSVMIRGWGLGSIWWDVLILLAFATVMLTLSAYGLRRRR